MMRLRPIEHFEKYMYHDSSDAKGCE